MENTGKSVAESLEFEEGKQNLTEAQEQAVLDEVLKEINGEKNSNNDDNWVNPADAEAKELEEKEAQEAADAEAKSKAEDEATQKAEKDAQEKEEAEAKKREQETEDQTNARLAKEKEDADKKAADEKAAKATAASNQPFKIAEADRAKAIEELALKESLTLKEAEEQILKDEATINKYKKDPVEMARALRHTQREMDRAKAELEATRKAAGQPPAPVLNNVKDYVQSQIEPIKDKLIPAYRKENPELTEGLSDDHVYGLIKKDATDRTVKILEENESKIVSSAKEKRAELIMGLAEQDKTLLPDIKAQLDRCNARQLLSKDFNVQDIVDWAWGRQKDRFVKEAEDRGFKRGQEGAKILGEKTPGAGNKQAGGGGAAKTSGSRLSDEQKERALDMFDGAEGMADEDKFSAYIETYPEQFKK